VSTLRELHEAATGAPWETGRVPGFEHVVYANDDGSVTGVCRCDNNPRKAFNNGGKDPADAALIAALRNAYADGTLVERDDVYRCNEHPDECGGIPYAQGVADGIGIEREREDVGELLEAIEAYFAAAECVPSVRLVAAIDRVKDAHDFTEAQDAQSGIAAHIEQVTRERDWLAERLSEVDGGAWAVNNSPATWGDDDVLRALAVVEAAKEATKE
jgi:hypothetical protein